MLRTNQMTYFLVSTNLHLKFTVLLDAYDTDEVSPHDPPEGDVHPGGMIFHSEWNEVKAREVHFFYFLKAGFGEHLHASVHVVGPGHPLARAMQISVQPLGMLGVFHIGVIHAQLTNRAGQTLSL